MDRYSINTTHITGRLTRDPEVRTSSNGASYITLGLAKTLYNKTTQTKQTLYMDCYANGNYMINGINNNPNFRRGATVHIIGTITGFSNKSVNENTLTLKISLDKIVCVDFPSAENISEKPDFNPNYNNKNHANNTSENFYPIEDPEMYDDIPF